MSPQDLKHLQNTYVDAFVQSWSSMSSVVEVESLPVQTQKDLEPRRSPDDSQRTTFHHCRLSFRQEVMCLAW